MRRNKKLVKVLTGTLATAMLVSGTIPAYAATGTSGTNSTLAVTTTEAVEGTNAVNVYAQIGSSYTVTIPKTITLDGSTKTGSYTVSVAGDIAGDETVKVVPDASFKMSQTDKADVTASVTQDKTAWEVSEFGTAGNGSISASDLSAGAWNGTFIFNVGLEEAEAEVYGEDVALKNDNLSTYGIATEGDVVIPSVVTDSDGIKHKVTSIGVSAFKGCTGLTSVIIPEGVTSIGMYGFKGCTNLISVIVPEGVKSIGDSAFSGCKNLATINLPDGMRRIASGAFFNCEKLASINISDNIIKIEEQAFYNCFSLTSINMPGKIKTIEDNAFAGCALTSVNYNGTAYESKSTLVSGLSSNGVTVSSEAFYKTKLTD